MNIELMNTRSSNMVYRYQPLSQTMLSHYPYTHFQLLDNQTSEKIKKSPWEIICSVEMIAQIHPKYYPMICAAAADYWDKDKRYQMKCLNQQILS